MWNFKSVLYMIYEDNIKVRTFAKAYITFQQIYNNAAQNNPAKFFKQKKRGEKREILNCPITTPPPSFCFVASDDDDQI